MQVGAEADRGAVSGLSAGRSLWRKGRPAESRLQVAGNRPEAQPRQGHGGRTGKAPSPGGQGAWPASHQRQQLVQGLSQLLHLSLSPCCCFQVSGTHDFKQTTPVWPHTHHTHITVPVTWTGRDTRHRDTHVLAHTAKSMSSHLRLTH